MAVIDPIRPGIYMRYENVGTVGSSTGSVTGGGGFSGPVDDTIYTSSFASLGAAIEAAEDGGIVLINADTIVSSPIRVPEGKHISLRIPAGVTLGLEAGASNYGMVVKGDVTIEGKGDIVVTGYGFGTSIGTESKLTIKGGHFIAKGCDYLIGCFDGDVVIEGGEFDGEYCVVNNFSAVYKTDGKVKISGGTFRTSDPEGFDVLGEDVDISGGRFSKPVDEKYCAEGHAVTAGEDGYYTVA